MVGGGMVDNLRDRIAAVQHFHCPDCEPSATKDDHKGREGWGCGQANCKACY